MQREVLDELQIIFKVTNQSEHSRRVSINITMFLENETFHIDRVKWGRKSFPFLQVVKAEISDKNQNKNQAKKKSKGKIPINGSTLPHSLKYKMKKLPTEPSIIDFWMGKLEQDGMGPSWDF